MSHRLNQHSPEMNLKLLHAHSEVQQLSVTQLFNLHQHHHADNNSSANLFLADSDRILSAEGHDKLSPDHLQTETLDQIHQQKDASKVNPSAERR